MNIQHKKTAALLIGFGGPTNNSEVRPFLESVLEGISIPPQRFDEVLRHYEVIGGVSPYNAVTAVQKNALEEWFLARNVSLPVGVGYRHSTPALKDAFETFKRYGIEKVIAFILASFRCYSSFEKYQLKAAEAMAAAGAQGIELVYTDPFFDNALYLQAQTERVLEITASFSDEQKSRTYFLFSAHSIPVPMSEKSGYRTQYTAAAAKIAKRLGLAAEQWFPAYQSRSGSPGDPWLEPDIRSVIGGIDTTRFSCVTLIPVGFLCDNVEVIFDLDVATKGSCETRGLGYFRASTVTDHPKFIEMMGRQILDKV